MLLYKNGRFCANGFSFALPDSVFLDTDPALCHENGLTFTDENRRFSVQIFSERSNADVAGELSELARACRPLSGPVPVQAGGLAGGYLLYSSGNAAYCEYRLARPGSPLRVTILLTARTAPESIPELARSSTLQSLVNSLKAENPSS